MDRPLLILALWAGCRCSAGEPELAAGGVIDGVCEASAVVLQGERFLVADNEVDDRLFSFDRNFGDRKEVRLAHPIEDIEALALDNHGGLWVVGSHSRNKSGEPQPERDRILGPDGTLYALDLGDCPCASARAHAPESGGFNIEGAAWYNDRLWLGLRSPVYGGKAVWIETDKGKLTRWVTQDLGGLGVRDALHTRESYALGGPADGAPGPFRLFVTAGYGANAVPILDLPESTEGIAVELDPDGARLVYVTDGEGKKGKCAEPSRWGRIPLPGRPMVTAPGGPSTGP